MPPLPIAVAIVVSVAAASFVAGCADDGEPQAKVKGATVSRACRKRSASEQAAQMLVVLVPSPSAAKAAVAAGLAGGYALEGNQTADVAAQIADTDSANPDEAPLTVASDEEGGTVQRMRDVLGSYPAAADVAAARTPAEAGADFEAYARKVKALGVTMLFGPVLDVGGGSALGSRSFADDPSRVADYGRAVLDATRRAGLTPVVKHWPGLGRGQTDTHDASDALPALDELAARDLVPFRAAFDADAPAVMVSHGTVAELGATPVSQSARAITTELREAEGFKGLVITDSLGMGAVGTDEVQAAERAIAAGADVALVSGPAVAAQVHEGLTDAISSARISRARVSDAIGHVLTAKGVDCSG